MVGCLPPFLLLILGAAIGALVGGNDGAIMGGGAGFAIGLIVMVALVWLLMKARNR